MKFFVQGVQLCLGAWLTVNDLLRGALALLASALIAADGAVPPSLVARGRRRCIILLPFYPLADASIF